MDECGGSPGLRLRSRISRSASYFPLAEYRGRNLRRIGTLATHFGEKSRRTVAGSSYSSQISRGV